MTPPFPRLRRCLGLVMVFVSVAAGQAADEKLPFAISLVPHGRTFVNLAKFEFTVRASAESDPDTPIRSAEFEIRNAQGNVQIARLAYDWEVGYPTKDQRPRRCHGSRVLLAEEDLRRIGELAPGEYHMAFLLNGKRASNVVAFRIDPEFDAVKAPTFELGVLEKHPLGKFSVPILWVIGPTPPDTRISNFSVAGAGLVVDGVERKVLMAWTGPVGLIQNGDRSFFLPDLAFYVPPIGIDQSHLYGFTLAGRTSKPLWVDPAATPLGDAWDEAVVTRAPQPPAIVRGTVTDAGGKPAAGYVVWLQTPVHAAAKEVTDEAGRYVFSGSLRPGVYRLCVAASENAPEKFRETFVLEKNADETRDFDFRRPAVKAERPEASPLFEAVRRGQIDRVRNLLDDDAPPTERDEEGLNVAALAAQLGDAAMIGLLAARGIDLNAMDDGGRTPLIRAAMAGHTAAANALIVAGADVNFANQDGFTALFAACAGRASGRDFEGVVKTVLDAGAKPDVETVTGATSFTMAAAGGMTGAMELLAEAGADVRGGEGRKAMAEAIQKKHSEVLATLLKLGANPNGAVQNHYSALFYAIYCDDPVIVQVLIEGGADVNAAQLQPDNEVSPLMIAAQGGNAKIVRQLLKAGAKIEIRDKRGYTALDYANRARNKSDVLRVLRAAGAKEGPKRD